MADNNRDRDEQNSDNREEAVLPVPLPLSSTASGYMPAVVPIRTEVDKADVNDAGVERLEPVAADHDQSDERIDREITDHLTQHSYIDATEVVVTVKDGDVTLSGSVPDDDQSHYVEEIAQKVAGVKHIHNQLTIKKSQNPLTQNTAGKQ